MPLVAFAGEERVEAPFVSDADWVALKGSHRRTGLLMVCGQPGIPKTSSRGLRFFAHSPGGGCVIHRGAPETVEHLSAKAAIAAGARDAGWEAVIEFPAADRSWIADVMLVSPTGRRVACEVQWSPQSQEEFDRRTARYEAEGVEVRWFLGARNRARRAGRAYVVDGEGDALTLDVARGPWVPLQPLPLREAVRLLLDGTWRRGIEWAVRAVEVGWEDAPCQGCQAPLTRWFLGGVIAESRCGLRHVLRIGGGDVGGLSRWGLPDALRRLLMPRWAQPSLRRPELFVQERVIASLAGSGLPAGSYRDEPGGSVFTCRGCGAEQGPIKYARERPSRWSYNTVPWSGEFRLAESLTDLLHLCFDQGRGQCTPTRWGDDAWFPAPGYGASAFVGRSVMPVRR